MPAIRGGNGYAIDDLQEFTGMTVEVNNQQTYFLYRAVSAAAWHVMEPYVTKSLKHLIRVDFGMANRAADLLEHEGARSGVTLDIDPVIGVTKIVVHAPVTLAADYEPKMRIVREEDYMAKSSPRQTAETGTTVRQLVAA
jgi:hypothetical protein